MSQLIVSTVSSTLRGASLARSGSRPVIAEVLQEWALQMADLEFTGIVVTVPYPAAGESRAVGGCYPAALAPAFRTWRQLATTSDSAAAAGLIASFPLVAPALKALGFQSWVAMRAPLPGGSGLEVLMFSPNESGFAAAPVACWRTLNMADELWRAAADAVLWLTPRERECLQCALEGMSADKTGALLNVSAHTVIYHLKNAIEKFQANGKIDAAWRAMQLGAL